MPVRDRPCRWDCNNRRCDPVRCFGRTAYAQDDPRAWLGRGWQDVPGKPFGWAWQQEREAIRQHLLRHPNWHSTPTQLHFRVDAIQRRLHREKPTLAERQAEWRDRCAREAEQAPEPFTADELAMIAERFAGANDPVGQGIAAKADAMQRRVTR